MDTRQRSLPYLCHKAAGEATAVGQGQRGIFPRYFGRIAVRRILSEAGGVSGRTADLEDGTR